MDLSIIVVSYNAVDFLRLCLKSVEAACKSINAEVFVVDNNSSDHSVKMVAEEFPSVNLIANKNNPGFSIANNQAIHQSQGKYILLLNPDTIVAEDTFVKVISFMNQTENAGGLGIKMLDGSGLFLPESKRGIPSPWTSFAKMSGLSSFFPTSRLFSEYHKGYLSPHKNNSVEVLAGAFMCFRKSVLDKVGLLDEGFFMYGEDIDLSYRIIKSNFKNYYFADSAIIHFKGESTTKNSKYINRFYKAMIQFAHKHYSKVYGWLLSVFIYLGVFMAKTSYLIKHVYASGKNTSVSGDETLIILQDHLPSVGILKALSENNKVQVVESLSDDLNGIILFVEGRMSYKQMIEYMDKYKQNFKYRFCNEEHRLIIGSDDKFVKGGVIGF
ncbi:glycosyltransferase family 2 protein [Labilibacter sediminis]|nr:glycosyltransferase family 2 protein [Labilibacter sediminis]